MIINNELETLEIYAGLVERHGVRHITDNLILAAYRRLSELNSHVEALESKLCVAREALQLIANYGGNGICPYGCDTPSIAINALAALSSISPCPHEVRIKQLEEALLNLMKSADVSWYTGKYGGHDWREAVDAAHLALVKYGRRAGKVEKIMDRAEKRFWRFVGQVDENGCWPWVGSLNFGGYGQFWFNGEWGMAHKYSYSVHQHQIPIGLTIDHICRNRGCVNPAHMEVVSMRENIIRGVGPTAVNSRKTHCPKGHEYTNGNTLVNKKSGKRQCRTCGKVAGYKRRGTRMFAKENP